MRHGAVRHGRPEVVKRARAVGVGADGIEHGAARKMVVAADGAGYAPEVGILPGATGALFSPSRYWTMASRSARPITYLAPRKSEAPSRRFPLSAALNAMLPSSSQVLSENLP